MAVQSPSSSGLPPHSVYLLRDDDLSPADRAEVLDLAASLKADRFAATRLAGPCSVAIIFQKSSLRTRVSFEVGTAELQGSRSPSTHAVPTSAGARRSRTRRG
jgi:ornithine carbamoyltransferase